MTPANFQFLAGFLKKRSGLVIAADKTYLIESRLNPIARRLGHASLDAVADALRAGKSPTLETAVVEAMTTNESSFFRDRSPFDRMKTLVFPRLLAARSDELRLMEQRK
jgi:chemotaxis protein methyltransferase CheR